MPIKLNNNGVITLYHYYFLIDNQYYCKKVNFVSAKSYLVLRPTVLFCNSILNLWQFLEHIRCANFLCSLKKGFYSESSCNFTIFVANFTCSLTKKDSHSDSSSDLSTFAPKFFDFLITCVITIIFSKSSTEPQGFSNFHGTMHKIPICFVTHNLRSPDISVSATLGRNVDLS